MNSNDYANRGVLRYLYYDNPVPSLSGDTLEGQTTKTHELNEFMKSVHVK